MKHNVIVNLTPKGQIRLRVSFMGHRVEISTGLSYDADKWRDGKAKPNTKNSFRQSATEINNAVSKYIDNIDSYFIRCDLDGKNPTESGVKQSIKIKTNTGSLTFDVVYNEFLQDYSLKRQISSSRLRCFNWLRGIVLGYDNSLRIGDINEQWVLDFKDYLLRKYVNNSLSLLQVTFDSFLKFCNKKKFTNLEIKDTRIKIRKIKEDAKIFLEDDELQRFEEVEIPNKVRAYARDLFIFCCYCGLRISDVWKLKKTDISNNMINTITQKTGKLVHIDLNNHTRRLIEKYTNMYPDDIRLFPKRIHSFLNYYLQDIAQLAHIDSLVTVTTYQGDKRIEETLPKWQVISSHAARRTFVVQCLERNIPALVIIKWTGHANLAALSPYIAIVDKLKSEEMRKFDK